ncbi:MAG: NTP transferase domain-containing protein, partial [Oscillospiraceae bacterium]|nr:NTP transferase domain-containing protein [Oscillospiraceae bacterium]
MKAKNISGIVLAGGFSKRMGTDKAELKLGGMTLLELQVRKLQQIGITDIMVSGYGKPVEGTRAIEDIYPHKGPMSGIHACLKAAK